MPATKKRRPPMEMEPGEGKKHEMGESPDEEVREGSEENEGHYSKASRKRSAKGAKRTKAPMDAESCGCGGGKGKKCSCDGGCGSYKKMDSALTPHEYLAACDIGIQDRSRQYIRARLDATERLDLKCGNGSISQGEKCTKGTASNAPDKVVNQAGVQEKDKYSFKKQQSAWRKHGAIAGATAGAVGGALLGASRGGIKGALVNAALGGLAGGAFGAAAGQAEGTLRAAGNRTARAYVRNRQNIRNANEAIKRRAPKWEKEINAAYKTKNTAYIAATEQKQAREIGNLFDRHSTQIWTNENKRWSDVAKEGRAKAKRRDSVFATGFTPEYDHLAI